MKEEIIEFVCELNPSCSLLLIILDGFFLFWGTPPKGGEYYQNETPFIFLNILTHPQDNFYAIFRIFRRYKLWEFNLFLFFFSKKFMC